MKLSLFKSTLIAALLMSAQMSFASLSSTAVSTKVGEQTLSLKASEIALDPADKKTVNIKLMGSEMQNAAITAHTADEANWLLRFLLRSKSAIQLNYDNSQKKEALSDVARYTISIDSLLAQDLDVFLDVIRHAYETQQSKYTKDKEGRWDDLKSKVGKKEKVEFPAGFPTEGVWE